jgi:hypothetical protein
MSLSRPKSLCVIPQCPFRKRCRAIALLGFLLVASTSFAANWIRAGINSDKPIWGLRGGLQFAIHPGGFTWGNGGPRGLIRMGYPTLPDGGYDLINFIAIEPIVGRARGLSELEKSSVDGEQGKMFRAGESSVTVLSNGIEELTVPLQIEKFENGAHVYLVLSQRSDQPDELMLRVHAESDSVPMESCILTATMGNKARTRLLWLRDGPVSSLKIFGDYRESRFTPHAFFPLDRLSRKVDGDVLVAITTNENNPAKSNAGLSRGWQYRGEKVTQYWRKPAANLDESLRCAVNARFKFWMSETPIPGGLAYENFELIEDFYDGQTFVFGVTKRSEAEVLK